MILCPSINWFKYFCSKPETFHSLALQLAHPATSGYNVMFRGLLGFIPEPV